jgi:hypothetical protein
MKNPKILLVVACLALAFSPAAFAGSFTFVTPAGSMSALDGPVNAQAVFTTGAGTLSISLSNLIVNQTSVGQNLSDLFFTINGITIGGSLTSSSAVQRDVASNGTFTDGATVSTGWQFTVSGGVFHLNSLTGVNNASQTLIGLPDGSNVYSNANSSIAGSGPHNPFLRNDATFSLAFAGMTADTIISGATFSFGTTAGDNVVGVPRTPVPDNGTTLVLLGITLAAVEGSRRLLAARI